MSVVRLMLRGKGWGGGGQDTWDGGEGVGREKKNLERKGWRVVEDRRKAHRVLCGGSKGEERRAEQNEVGKGVGDGGREFDRQRSGRGGRVRKSAKKEKS